MLVVEASDPGGLDLVTFTKAGYVPQSRWSSTKDTAVRLRRSGEQLGRSCLIGTRMTHSVVAEFVQPRVVNP